jgi:hypothetical protein
MILEILRDSIDLRGHCEEGVICAGRMKKSADPRREERLKETVKRAA